MHTLSSARRTCMAFSSAVECTATVEMPSSRHALITRSAISPLFAIRILSNMLFDDQQRLAIFHGLAILDEDVSHPSRAWRLNLVHGLHGFDDDDRLPLFDLSSDLDEICRARRRSEISRAYHRRLDCAWMRGPV